MVNQAKPREGNRAPLRIAARHLQALMDERIWRLSVAAILHSCSKSEFERYSRGYLYPQNNTIVVYRTRPPAFGIPLLYALVRRNPPQCGQGRLEVSLDCDCCVLDVSIDVQSSTLSARYGNSGSSTDTFS